MSLAPFLYKVMKIIVGLSGGVDSSVAAYLLKQQGCDVEAMYMQNWHDITGTLHGECEWEEEKVVAEMVARKIGIPFHFVDLSDDYRKQVVDYMFSEYAAGRTPNPDVLCNSKIKFASFLEKVEELGGDYVATGHYCKKETVNAGGKEIYRILAGDDQNKDQSYFLCQLSQQQLSKALFPIGHLTKPQVREIARQAGLPSAEKKDSQGICFVGKVDLPVFLQQKLKSKEGNVVEIFSKDYEAIRSRQSLDDFSPVRYNPEDGKNHRQAYWSPVLHYWPEARAEHWRAPGKHLHNCNRHRYKHNIRWRRQRPSGPVSQRIEDQQGRGALDKGGSGNAGGRKPRLPGQDTIPPTPSAGNSPDALRRYVHTF